MASRPDSQARAAQRPNRGTGSGRCGRPEVFRVAGEHSLPADALGKLLDARYRELELFLGVSAAGRGALFVHPRIGSHQAHESLRQLLAFGGEARARLSAARPRVVGRLAHRAGLGFQVGLETGSQSMNETPPRVKPFVDLSDEQVHWDLSEALSYSQYLNLDKLLAAQHPLSYEHDEMLFIIIHQVSELWMKLCLHELNATVACVRRDDLGPTFKMLARVSTIQQQLLQSWDVLATITPHDYSAFRNTLGKSSGFQSPQYRMLEFLIGNKSVDTIKVFRSDPQVYETLERALRAPSLYDEVLRLLSRRGLDVPAELIDRDFTQPYQASKQVAAAWLSVYHNSVKEWDLYELAERLVDLDYKFQLWRFAHVKTVERIIGDKRGTGGTGGVSYLTKALELKFFPELWTIRTSM